MSNPDTRYAQLRGGVVAGQYDRAEQAAAAAAAMPGDWVLVQFDIDPITNETAAGSAEVLGQFDGALPIRYVLWSGNRSNSQTTQYCTQQAAAAALAALGRDAASYTLARVVLEPTTGEIIDGVLLDPITGASLVAEGPVEAQLVPVDQDRAGGSGLPCPSSSNDSFHTAQAPLGDDQSPDQTPDDDPDQTPHHRTCPTLDPASALGETSEVNLAFETRSQLSFSTASGTGSGDQAPSLRSPTVDQRGGQRNRQRQDRQQLHARLGAAALRDQLAARNGQPATPQAPNAALGQQAADPSRKRFCKPRSRGGARDGARGGPRGVARGGAKAGGAPRAPRAAGPRGRWTPAPMAGSRMARQLHEDRATANNGVGRRRRRTEAELLLSDAIRLGYTQVPNMSIVTGEPLTGKLERFQPRGKPDETREFVARFTAQIWKTKMDRSRAIDAAAVSEAARMVLESDGSSDDDVDTDVDDHDADELA